jgi:hypothetical protein
MMAAVITLARMLAITRPDHHVLHRECLLRTVRAYLTFSYGELVEHWDVIEDEVSREASVSGLPMFGDTFPEDRAEAI